MKTECLQYSQDRLLVMGLQVSAVKIKTDRAIGGFAHMLNINAGCADSTASGENNFCFTPVDRIPIDIIEPVLVWINIIPVANNDHITGVDRF